MILFTGMERVAKERIHSLIETEMYPDDDKEPRT